MIRGERNALFFPCCSHCALVLRAFLADNRYYRLFLAKTLSLACGKASCCHIPKRSDTLCLSTIIETKQLVAHSFQKGDHA